MGRNFQTAPTQFIEDYIYQPPWELMQQAAAQKQQTYDLALASTKFFNKIPIDHLQGEDDVYNVQEKQRYYAENAANIAKAIQNDPAKAKQYMSNIEALQSELEKDMTSGDLSHIIGSAQAYKKWQEDNKKLKEDEPARYAAAEKAYLANYINAGGNSISQRFKGDLVTKDVDWNKYIDSVEKLKASVVKGTTSTPTGTGYIVEHEGKTEVMDSKRLKAFLFSKVMNPTDLASLRQSQQFGLGTYFSDPEMTTLDYEASGFNNFNLASQAMAYTNEENSTKVSGDTTWVAKMNEAGEESRFQRKQAWEREKTNIEQAGANARSKEEAETAKNLAYQTKIAEYMAEGEYGKAAELSKLFDQARGGTGSTTSKTGSRYRDFNILASKAKTDPAAKKLIEQTLPTALKQAGINFNDPEQAKLAKTITDGVIKGTINVNNIEEVIEKAIPVSINKTINKSTEEFLRNRSFIKANNEKKKNNEEIQMKKRQIEQNKALVNNPAAKSRIQKLESEIQNLENRNKKITPDLIFKESVAEFKSNYQGFKDSNKEKREKIVERFKSGFETATKTFDDKRDFDTYYETSPSDAISSSRILNMFADPNFKKEFTVEIVNKNGESIWKDMDEISNNIEFTSYEGLVKTGPLGTPMAVLKDSDGKIYNVTANGDTSQMKHLINTAVNGMTNPSSQLAYQEILIPEASKIINTMQALKLKGKTYGKQPMQFGDKYMVLEYDASGRVNLYDPMQSSTKPLFSNPVSPLEAGKYLNTLIK